MKRGHVIAAAGDNHQVYYLGGKKMLLGLGPVMLPLSAGNLRKLASVVDDMDDSFDLRSSDGLAFIHCDPMVFRLDRESCTLLAIVLDKALSWLDHGSPS